MMFRLLPKPVTVNGLGLEQRIMALILRYFTEFVYDVVVKQLLGLHPFQNLRFIVYDHINTICAIIRRLVRQNNKRRQYSLHFRL